MVVKVFSVEYLDHLVTQAKTSQDFVNIPIFILTIVRGSLMPFRRLWRMVFQVAQVESQE